MASPHVTHPFSRPPLTTATISRRPFSRHNLHEQEIKNGMVSPMSYLFAKSAAELPILFVMALFAIGIPAYGLSNFHSAGFMRFWLAWTVNF